QGGGGYERKPWQDRSQDSGGGYERRPYQDRNQGGGGYERKPWQDRSQDSGGGYERRPYQDRNQGGGGYERKPWQDRSQDSGGGYERRPYRDRNHGGGGYERRPYQDRNHGGYDRRPPQGRGGFGGNKPFGKRPPFKRQEDFHVEILPKAELPSGEGMPLNKFLAHCGVASRRKAVEFIEQGLVTVNGEVVKEPYYRYQLGDAVACDGKPLTIQERQVYILLNKPKGVITTTDDEHGRATVLDIVDPHIPERIYPVGRLDRDTTGLLLLTNDGELAQKLTHPSHHVQKQYRVGLGHSVSPRDMDKIAEGFDLDDGPVRVNWIRYAEDHPGRDVVELEITEGRNRIVRRIFEALGYEVRKLDRFYFAGLTKKDLARGQFRDLTQREIIMLKHFTGHPSTARPALVAHGDDSDADDFHDDMGDEGASDN
ncbi:MAG: pseudouridine synthase, partial [Saprospiraceae bacterium]